MNTTLSSIENILPSVIVKIAKELTELVEKPVEGIKIIPNEENIVDIQALIEGPSDTPFQGGVFKMKLILSPDFPQSPPKGYFLTKIFHPNVSKTGEICVNTLKKDWKADLGIKHILLTIKCLLIYPNPESALNEEAGRLLLERYDDYFKHAKLMTGIHAIKGGLGSIISNTTSITATSITATSITENENEDSKMDNSENEPSSAIGGSPKKKAPVATSSGASSSIATDKQKKLNDKKRNLKRL